MVIPAEPFYAMGWALKLPTAIATASAKQVNYLDVTDVQDVVTF